jgi:hypothetical protein
LATQSCANTSRKLLIWPGYGPTRALEAQRPICRRRKAVAGPKRPGHDGGSRCCDVRRFLLAWAVFLAMLAIAQVDPKIHKQCIEAKDYAGCVKAFTSSQQESDDGLGSLRAAMKQVAARIRSGFSLRDSTLFFQPVTDQQALASSKHPASLAVQNASKAAELFNITQTAWQSRINTLQVGTYTGTTYSCEPTKRGVKAFNDAAGKAAITYSVKGGLFGLVLWCNESVGLGHEAMMLSYISGLLESGSVSPEEIAAREKAEQEQKAKATRELELCAMGPWNRYLEENPGIRKWADANPTAAEMTKKKFLQDPKNQAACKADRHNWKNTNFSWKNPSSKKAITSANSATARQSSAPVLG